MRFKRLEIIGFKSFRDRTILEFEPGVTAIVGPNGCGKSNISDAIRWVLGEQSAKDLRGSRMEDVIFNGTERDEPLGLAEVSLTLSNEKKFLPIEYDEVTLTRRIFRSGESEYLINHVPVRLRDVAGLCMGTGLGQTSYAHMAQGKIDEILSARPEERRQLFEEASGITKYRSQKKEALRKLEQTEANLLRVGDILTELVRQIHSLERQADKARRYQEDFEKLKTLELGVAREEWGTLIERETQISQEKNGVKEEEGKLLEERRFLSEKMDLLRKDLETLESHLSALQSEKMNLVSSVRQNDDRILLDRERIEELASKKEKLSKERGELEKDLVELRQHLESSQGDFEKIVGEIETKQKSFTSLECALKEIHQLLASGEERISEGKMKTIDLAQEHSKVKNDLTRIATQLHALAGREHRLLLEKEAIQTEQAGVRSRREAAEAAVKETEGEASLLREERKALEEKEKFLSQKLQDLGRDILALRQTLTALSSRCDLLEEAKKNYEGFSQGAKAILKEIEKKNALFQKFHGVLADLLEVTPGCERAIEELLGSMAQALVVEDEEAAREGVRYLESNGLGRASFIPLSSFSNSKDLFAPHSSSDGALQVVRTTQPYQKILAFFLGNGILVDEIGKIRSEETFRKTYVTAKGELYRQGVLTGGRTLADEFGLVGRESKIVSLKEEISRVEKALQGGVDEERLLEESRKNAESELIQKRDECQKWEVELSNRESFFASVQAEEIKINEEFSLTDLELEEVRGELSELREKETAFTEELRQLEEGQQKLQEDLLQTQTILSQKREEREGVLIQLTEVRTELASVSAHCDEQKKNYVLLEKAYQERVSSIASRSEEAKASEQRVEELSREILKLETDQGALRQSQQRLSETLTDSGAAQKEKDQEAQSLEAQLSAADSRFEAIRNSFHELQMKEQEISYGKKSIDEKLQIAYKVDIQSQLGEPEEGFSETARSDIARLREKLDRIGPVNLVAIEEDEELKKRNAFLAQQKDDLERAKICLLEAIQKINKVTKELFLDTFERIQTNFQEYFKLLFGGGEARLLLLDEEDVLESGIEILACPPGKKLQSVSLLSGGERAMTVISLLFAVFKEKPSPFCVLDEIDAPLDESNVARFTAVLHDFLKSSQFILVTHNKRTISMADVMYGITMEKSGVSKIVSVKFKEEAQIEAVPA